MTRLSPRPSVPSPSPRLTGRSSCRHWRTRTSAEPIGPRATIVGRSPASSRRWRPSTGDDAGPLLTQALEQTAALERVDMQALCLLPLGEAHLLAGHLEDAHTVAERALGHARAHQERGNEAYALRLLGDIAARHEPSESEQAKTHYRQALTLAEELGMRPLQAHCHRGLGTLYAATGQPEQARTELSTAIALYRDMEMAFWLPQAEAALAQVEAR